MLIRLPTWLPIYQLISCYSVLSRLSISFENIGKTGENFAANWLRKKFFYIIDRNWKISSGEIDLVAIYGYNLHFIEVKTRQADLPVHFSAQNAVDHIKLKKLSNLAQIYCYQNVNMLTKFRIKTYQIDLIAVSYRRLGCLVSMECQRDPLTNSKQIFSED